jgi:hypothetical protein
VSIKRGATSISCSVTIYNNLFAGRYISHEVKEPTNQSHARVFSRELGDDIEMLAITIISQKFKIICGAKFG